MHEADIEFIPWVPGDFSGMQEDASADWSLKLQLTKLWQKGFFCIGHCKDLTDPENLTLKSLASTTNYY